MSCDYWETYGVSYFIICEICENNLPLANESCEGYEFYTCLSFFHRGGLAQCMLGCAPPPPDQRQTSRDQRQAPPVQCMLGDVGNKRVVHIPLLDVWLVKGQFTRKQCTLELHCLIFAVPCLENGNVNVCTMNCCHNVLDVWAYVYTRFKGLIQT